MAMTFAEYAELAQVTRNGELALGERWKVCLAGLVGELGEVFDLLKKEIGHGHGQQRDKLVAECGDFCWYVAEAAATLGITLGLPDSLAWDGTPYTQLWRVQRELLNFANYFDETWVPNRGPEFSRSVSHYAARGVKLNHVWFCFLAFLAAAELDVQEVMQHNISKLRARYPHGFSSEASINRTV